MSDIDLRPSREGCIYIWGPLWEEPYILMDLIDKEVEYYLSAVADGAEDAEIKEASSLQVYVVTDKNLKTVTQALQGHRPEDFETVVVVPVGALAAEQQHVAMEMGKTLQTLGATVCAHLEEAAGFINDYWDEMRLKEEALCELGQYVWDE